MHLISKFLHTQVPLNFLRKHYLVLNYSKLWIDLGYLLLVSSIQNAPLKIRQPTNCITYNLQVLLKVLQENLIENITKKIHWNISKMLKYKEQYEINY